MNLPAASRRGIHVDVIAPADSNLSSFVVHEWLDVRNGAGSSIYILRGKQRDIGLSLRTKIAGTALKRFSKEDRCTGQNSGLAERNEGNNAGEQSPLGFSLMTYTVLR
jgi:hypothetical protein